jgi:hypothetical protein
VAAQWRAASSMVGGFEAWFLGGRKGAVNLQERFYPYRLAALGTPSYDTCERMLHNTGPIDNNTGLRWSARSVSCILVTWTVTWSWEWFVTKCARMRHVHCSVTKRRMKLFLRWSTIYTHSWLFLGFNDSIYRIQWSTLWFNDSI